MRKKVLFFLYSLAGGGAERTVINIINNLNKEEYEVMLVLGSKKNNDYINLLDNKVDVKFLNCTKLRYCILKLASLIRQEKPDLLFSTINSNNIALLLAKILSFKKTPIIVREANNRTQSGSVTFKNKLLTRILYNHFANKVISLSKGVANDLIHNFNITKNKITVIYNPVEVERIRNLAKENVDLSDIKQSPNEKIIVSAGRLVEQKDFKTLLKSFSIVSKKMNSRLIILGKGPEEKKLKRYSRQLDIIDKVHFLGFKANPYKYIKNADLFVLSSKWEGFGHVIVESMVVGTPVISTNCKSGPSEIIGNNQYGLLVPVEDEIKMSEKIIEILNDKKKYEKYKIKGQQRAKDFNAVNIIKQYEKVFKTFV